MISQKIITFFKSIILYFPIDFSFLKENLLVRIVYSRCLVKLTKKNFGSNYFLKKIKTIEILNEFINCLNPPLSPINYQIKTTISKNNYVSPRCNCHA